ncbi:MAG: hypothetical protein Q7K26_02845 [bacterium]|nr:hypothetical protein [bacterium]
MMNSLYRAVFIPIFLIGFWVMNAPQVLEAAGATQVYYSAGQNTTDHKTGSPLRVSISNGIATFSVAQTAPNMGVGDRVTYSGNQKVFISGKISQTQWNVVTVKGGVPTDVTNAIVNSIRHEFDSLNNAMSIYKGNQSSDINHLNTLDLVAGNYVLNIPLYYDTGPEYFNGGGISAAILIEYFNTGPNNYIRIYTPTNTASEVNLSQRHDGKWNNQKYSLIFSPDNNSTAAIRTYVPYTKIDGLQIKIISSNDGNHGIEASYIDNGWVEFSNNIITGQILNYASGISIGYADTDVDAKIWNNLIYDLRGTAGPGSSTGIIYGSCYNISCVSGTGYIYNNIVVNTPYGISNNSSDATIVAKNNIVQDATVGFYSHAYNGYFDPSSTNNISHHKNDSFNDAPGSNPQNNTVVSFVDKAGKDFHLSPSDNKALNKGSSLIGDSNLQISSDIDGDSRPSGLSWDIGADELAGPPRVLDVSIAIGEGTVSGTIGLEGDGISCPGDCNETYSDGTWVTLIATPGAGYIFDSWTGACIGQSDICSILVDSDQATGANFAYPFNYSISNSGTSYVTKTNGDAFTTNTITKTYVIGTKQPVTLSVSGQPAGVTPSISGQNCELTCSSVITFTVSPSTPADTYPIVVTGSPLDKTTSFDLVISGNPLLVTCRAVPAVALLGESVTWTADVSGGTPPLTYAWSGSNIPGNPSPDTNPFSISYNTIGQKTAEVVVTDADSLETTCSASAQINFDPKYQEI